MNNVSDIIRILEDFAPVELAYEWDSVGLQIGDPNKVCRTVAVTLDLGVATLEEAIAREADLIVAHHPLLFRSPKEIRFDRPHGHLIQRLCEEKISFYAIHTNLDSTIGGLNDFLVEKIGLVDSTPLVNPPKTLPETFHGKTVGLGRVGPLKKPGTLKQLAKRLTETFEPESLRIIGHEHQEVSTVAICTGSGGSLIREAIASNADCFITGDVKYHQALDAEAAGMAVLDLGHYASEIPAIQILSNVLKKGLDDTVKIVPLTTAHDPLRSFRPL